jgi:uncharacterized protein
MLHNEMATVTVRVAPRSGRTAVEVGPEGIAVRVRSAPEAGKATEEARRALARALGVPPSKVALRTGARSQTKVFEVEGMTKTDVEVRLRAT